MRCTNCERPLLALFYSVICESCTDDPYGRFHVAYAVWEEQQEANGGSRLTYIFRTRHDAVRFRTIRGDESRPILCVLSEHPYEWRDARGVATGLTVGTPLCEVFPDHRFPPAPFRAFIAPPTVDPRAERVVISRGAEPVHEPSHSA